MIAAVLSAVACPESQRIIAAAAQACNGMASANSAIRNFFRRMMENMAEILALMIVLNDCA